MTRYQVEIGDQTFEVDIGAAALSIDGRRVDADLKSSGRSALWHLVLDGRSYRLCARRRDDGRGAWSIEVDGRQHEVVALDERARAIRRLTREAATARSPIALKAPMPGLIIAVEIAAGAQVEPGQGLIVMEAMKMENELKAPASGRVSQVRAQPGQAVDRGETLLVIDPGA